MRLDSQVPIVPDWDASRVGGMDHDAAGRAVRRVWLPHVCRARRPSIEPAAAAAAVDGRRGANYQLVDTPAKLAELVAQLARSNR